MALLGKWKHPKSDDKVFHPGRIHGYSVLSINMYGVRPGYANIINLMISQKRIASSNAFQQTLLAKWKHPKSDNEVSHPERIHDRRNARWM